MKKKYWLRNLIRKWLGFDNMFIGVDIGIKDESCVIIVSRLKGGQIRIMDMRFGDIKELKYFIRSVQRHYAIPDKNIISDTPLGMNLRL